MFGSLVGGVKTGFADWFVQVFVEKKDMCDVNWKRIQAFLLFGFIYLGLFQYFVYVPVFTRALFPKAEAFVTQSLRSKLADRAGQKIVMKQVALDLFVHEPFFYLLSFYVVKGWVMSGGGSRTGADPNFFRKSVAQWWRNLPTDMVAVVKVWGPAFAFIFSFCPLWARVPTTAAVSLIWTMILSQMRGGETIDGDDVVNIAGDAVTIVTTTNTSEWPKTYLTGQK
jgi:hypothetical protein